VRFDPWYSLPKNNNTNLYRFDSLTSRAASDTRQITTVKIITVMTASPISSSTSPLAARNGGVVEELTGTAGTDGQNAATAASSLS
jgi:hypothetical protein